MLKIAKVPYERCDNFQKTAADLIVNWELVTVVEEELSKIVRIKINYADQEADLEKIFPLGSF